MAGLINKYKGVEVTTANFRYHPGTAWRDWEMTHKPHVKTAHACPWMENSSHGAWGAVPQPVWQLGSATAQFDNCQFLTVEAQVQRHSSPCWIWCGYNSCEVGLSLSSMVCPLPIIVRWGCLWALWFVPWQSLWGGAVSEHYGLSPANHCEVGLSLSTMVCSLPIIPPLLHTLLTSWAGTLGQFEATVAMASASPVEGRELMWQTIPHLRYILLILQLQTIPHLRYILLILQLQTACLLLLDTVSMGVLSVCLYCTHLWWGYLIRIGGNFNFKPVFTILKRLLLIKSYQNKITRLINTTALSVHWN
jgi:hypothetical protein